MELTIHEQASSQTAGACTTERYYTAHPDSKYVLPSDEVERERLQFQHDLLKEQFNNELLPVSLHLEKGDRVLDSGTGSGTWALEISPCIPSGVHIVGSDIEPRLFPCEPPENTSFAVHSVLSLPEEWSSSFRLVHQRLLIAALGLQDWKQALSQSHRVLQPGGMIQLEEAGRIRYSPIPGYDISATLPHTYYHRDMLERLFRAKNLLLNCGQELPSLLEMAGFMDIEQKVGLIRLGPGEVGRKGRENFMGVYRGMKTPMLRAGGFGLIGSDSEWEKLMDDMEAEWEANEVVLEWYAFTAHKSSLPTPGDGKHV